MIPLTPAENHRYNRFKKLMKEGDCNTEMEIRYMLSRTRVWWRWAPHYAFFLVGLITFLFSIGIEVDARLSGHIGAVSIWNSMGTAFWCAMGLFFTMAPSVYGKKLKEIDEFGDRLIAENAANDSQK